MLCLQNQISRQEKLNANLPDENTWNRLNTRMTRRDALSIGGGLVVGAAAASAVFLATSHGAGTVTETTTKTTGGGMTTTITSAGSGVTTTVTTTTTSTEISSTVGTPEGNYIVGLEGYSIGFACQ